MEVFSKQQKANHLERMELFEDQWMEYERCKKALPNNLSPEEYELRVRAIARELRI